MIECERRNPRSAELATLSNTGAALQVVQKAKEDEAIRKRWHRAGLLKCPALLCAPFRARIGSMRPPPAGLNTDRDDDPDGENGGASDRVDVDGASW